MTFAAVFDLNFAAQASATGIVDCLIAGMLIAAFAAAVLRFARQSAGVRFAVWFSSLVAIALLPFLRSASWGQGTALHLGAMAHRPEIVVPTAWALYLFLAWALIATIALARVAAGLLQLRKLRQSCTPVDRNLLEPQLRATLERYAAARPVALCISDRISVPTAIGFVRPAVVLPTWLWNELPAPELNQVLLHELAHLRRFDDWTNLTQKIVKALFFFHPAVWWIEKKISLEREMACDDAVLAETASPRAYAECLAHLAEKSFIRRGIAMAQAAIGKGRQTSLRVAQILDINRPKGTRHGWKPAVTAIAAFAVACGLGISRAPKLVAFQDSHATADLPLASLSSTVPSATRAYVTNAALRTFSDPKPAAARKVSRSQASAARADYAANFHDSPAARGNSVVHMASSRADSAVATEAVFVVVETSNNGAAEAPSYQITVWRFTVRQPVGSQVSNTIPRKET